MYDKKIMAILKTAQQKPYYKDFLKKVIELKPSKEHLKIATDYLIP